MGESWLSLNRRAFLDLAPPGAPGLSWRLLAVIGACPQAARPGAWRLQSPAIPVTPDAPRPRGSRGGTGPASGVTSRPHKVILAVSDPASPSDGAILSGQDSGSPGYPKSVHPESTVLKSAPGAGARDRNRVATRDSSATATPPQSHHQHPHHQHPHQRSRAHDRRFGAGRSPGLTPTRASRRSPPGGPA
ncbi:hypothetical protein Franean1_0234 [Parafrankia sp. EAN1pec]|nr:hypothetical protein Franean1_0234 [Frankia sp. EAN1pec]